MSIILPNPIGTDTFQSGTVIPPIDYGDVSGYFSSNNSDWCGVSAFNVVVCAPPAEPINTYDYGYSTITAPPYTPPLINITPEPSYTLLLFGVLALLAVIKAARR